MGITFYQYWRSSSSWRVRWALALKGVPHRVETVDLLAGEQRGDAYRAVNPWGTVPCLVVDGVALAESVAIVEWLEETYPEPPLLPADPMRRARCRELVQIMNAGTQPLQNLLALTTHSAEPTEQARWASFWIRRGLDAYQAMMPPGPGPYSLGDRVTMADLYLVPQCANAARFGIRLDEWPRLATIVDACLDTEAARSTRPEAVRPPR